MQRKTLIVGLTGQTGAGKSLVCTLLTDRSFDIIDCDMVARKVVEKGRKCLLDLAVEFGSEIIDANGTLNRRKLGSIAFSNKENRKKLNQITFPYIKEELFNMIEKLRECGKEVVFLDAPTLIESGVDKYCDKVVSVIAPAEDRFVRIVRRDGLSAEEAGKRMSAQGDDEFYTSRSGFVIKNDGDMAWLRVQVMEMLDTLGIKLP